MAKNINDDKIQNYIPKATAYQKYMTSGQKKILFPTRKQIIQGCTLCTVGSILICSLLTYWFSTLLQMNVPLQFISSAVLSAICMGVSGIFIHNVRIKMKEAMFRKAEEQSSAQKSNIPNSYTQG